MPTIGNTESEQVVDKLKHGEGYRSGIYKIICYEMLLLSWIKAVESHMSYHRHSYKSL